MWRRHNEDACDTVRLGVRRGARAGLRALVNEIANCELRIANRKSAIRISQSLQPSTLNPHPSAFRRGITLVELLLGVSITALLSVVLGGIMMAVQTAREHTEGLEEATHQAQVALERIDYLVSHAGTYSVSGGSTTLGLAVVSRRTPEADLPEVLVIWCGGRQGGIASGGPHERLPRVNELVMIAPDPEQPGHLVEAMLPDDPAEIDFRAAEFSTTILNLIDSANAEKILLCDRIRRSSLSASGESSTTSVGNVRFELTESPSAADLASALPGTPEWTALPWAQGIVSADSGLRQTNVRIELQLVSRRRPPAGAESTSVAIPFFGSTSRRYAYQP